MKLRTKLPLCYAVLIAGLGALFILFTSSMVEDRMKEEEHEYFEGLTKALALNSTTAIALKDYASLRRLVDNVLSSEHVVYSAVIDGDGLVLAHSRHALEGKVVEKPPALGTVDGADLLMRRESARVVVATAPLVIAGHLWGAVKIGFSDEELAAKIRDAQRLIIILGVATVLVGVLASAFVARRLIEPINRLRGGAEIVSTGNLDHHVSVEGNDEVSDLANAFNEMTTHLKKNYQAVAHAKAEWESTFDAISDPLFIHDRDFHILRCNRAYADAAGKPFGEIIGRPYYEVFPKADGPMETCRRSLGMHERGEEEINLPELNRIYNAKLYVINSASDQYLYSLHILDDITERKHAEQEVHELFLAALTSLSEAIEAKSPWTHGHSERVAEYSTRIARAMGWSDAEVEELRIAALLHDIGKIGTYDGLLDKSGPLSDEEYELVKRHPMKGAEVLAPIKQLHPIIPWIRGHHERYDGTGYPDGLRAAEIPLAARILAVADAFDSMTADRPYRKTPGRANAVNEIKRCAGTQFDPEVVEAFLRSL